MLTKLYMYVFTIARSLHLLIYLAYFVHPYNNYRYVNLRSYTVPFLWYDLLIDMYDPVKEKTSKNNMNGKQRNLFKDFTKTETSYTLYVFSFRKLLTYNLIYVIRQWSMITTVEEERQSVGVILKKNIFSFTCN